MKSGYAIRLARSEDVHVLPAVELAASALYEDRADDLDVQPATLETVTQIREFESARQAGSLWVAIGPDGQPVGFALVREVDGVAHLEELDVHPSHGRQGLGATLLTTVCDWARETGFPAVTLSTFREVPWNGPFYARHGFRILHRSELSPGLVEIRELERRKGLRMDLRVMMRFETDVHRGP
jgi:GNAT superfamily N-acetyltransferase